MVETNKTKIYKIYWIYDAAKHNDIMTEGYVGCTSQSVHDRFMGHKHSKRSGKPNTVSNTKKHMCDFIRDAKDPQFIEICRTKDSYMASLVERGFRPRPYIGENRYKGGKHIGVQKRIYCVNEEGKRYDYESISSAMNDGFSAGSIHNVLKNPEKATNSPSLGKCKFYYA